MKPVFDKKRKLSWSAISSFEYDPEQWYRRYVLKEKDAPSHEMLFGKDVGEKLAKDPTFLPHVPRYPVYEYALTCNFGKIPLIGYIDGFDKHHPELGRPVLGEYKTGKKAWDQKRADEHGQIDMYLLQLWLSEKLHPDRVVCRLHWLPTMQHGDFSITFTEKDPIVHTFETRRTMTQILRFGARINRVYKEMEAYAESHP